MLLCFLTKRHIRVERQIPLNNVLIGSKGQVSTEQEKQENAQTPDGGRNAAIHTIGNPLRRPVSRSA